MTRSGTVAQRVLDLLEGFDRYVGAFDASPPFDSVQLASHRATITMLRQAGSVGAAVADRRFMARLRHTLVTWRLEQRGSQLLDEPEFGDALRKALPEITDLEPLRIDADDLPATVPDRLWDLLGSLGVATSNATIVAGTKTLHHLLPDLVPPMDRAWIGTFFDLPETDWQGAGQRATFLRVYHQLTEIARATGPQRHVTGEGWRTSRTKIIDNAVIGYCRTDLAPSRPVPAARPDTGLLFRVPGFPPAKGEALSMLGEGHSHASRVRALLTAARDAAAQARFAPIVDGPVALDLVVRPGPQGDAWDATNYLGGVADVLEDKSRRGAAIEHLGELARVWLYRDDRQIKQVTYREEPDAPVHEYVVTVRTLSRP